jgi:predicted class III extradiol MEMO1 family dioxygenase
MEKDSRPPFAYPLPHALLYTEFGFHHMRNAWVSVLMVLAFGVSAVGASPKVPIMHSTDLFHPHADPDDHYDLACLFAIPEFDIKGIVLDLGAEQAKGCGRPAVEQMMHITGRKAPYAVGLSRALSSRTEKALDQPAEFQG